MDASAYLPAGVPSSWLVCLGVDDVDAACAKAVQWGGTVSEPATDTPFGRLAQLADPTGAIIKINSIEG